MVLTPDMTVDEMVAALERERNSEEFKNLPKNIEFEDKCDDCSYLDSDKRQSVEELEREMDEDDRQFWGPLYGMAKWLGVFGDAEETVNENENELDNEQATKAYVQAIKSFLRHPEIKDITFEEDRKFLRRMKRRQNLTFFTINFCFALFVILLLLDEVIAGFCIFAVGAAIAFKAVFCKVNYNFNKKDEEW